SEDGESAHNRLRDGPGGQRRECESSRSRPVRGRVPVWQAPHRAPQNSLIFVEVSPPVESLSRKKGQRTPLQVRAPVLVGPAGRSRGRGEDPRVYPPGETRPRRRAGFCRVETPGHGPPRSTQVLGGMTVASRGGAPGGPPPPVTAPFPPPPQSYA